MKTKIDELRKDLIESLKSTWYAHWIDDISTGDWCLITNSRTKKFNSKEEAKDFIKDKYWKNKPFYYQPSVDEIYSDKTKPYSKEKILLLLDIIEKQHNLLKNINEAFTYESYLPFDANILKHIEETTEMLEGVDL